MIKDQSGLNKQGSSDLVMKKTNEEEEEAGLISKHKRISAGLDIQEISEERRGLQTPQLTPSPLSLSHP